jgi:hypothetical protein
MTVAVSVKVFDGMVFAVDSTTTFTHGLPGDQRQQTFDNADKLFHLHRKLPIAAMTWGLASVGPASISTLAKDFRRKITLGEDPHWSLDPKAYTVEQVATLLAEFMFEDRYKPKYEKSPEPPFLGLLIGGYSAGANQSESWLLEIQGASATPILRVAPDDASWDVFWLSGRSRGCRLSG